MRSRYVSRPVMTTCLPGPRALNGGSSARSAFLYHRETQGPFARLRIAQVSRANSTRLCGGNSHDWDLAAADLIVHEAGAALTSLRGDAPVYNRSVPRHPPLVAAGRERHEHLLRLIERQPRAFA